MRSPTTSPSASAAASDAAELLDLLHGRSEPALAALRAAVLQATAAARPDASVLRALGADCVRAFEAALPLHDYSDDALADYQRACRLHEAQRAELGDDGRHRFLVIVPTADRPRQLRECLASLLELCRLYGCGGTVAAMIADDSKDAASVERHRELARDCTAEGLDTAYFGLEEQRAELDRLPAELGARLEHVLGRPDRGAFYHKGHSVMRNILYLHLHARYGGDRRQLFYFADSDQEFKVKVDTGRGDRDVYALNYFHQLDRLFRAHDIELLTGKVVGDPPVSPAVMAGNFLEDVSAFLSEAGALAPHAPCPFHDRSPRPGDGAAYHDMAALFGFTGGAAAHRYRCTLHGAHSVAAGVEEFSRKLARFFDGEHPTRVTRFDAADPLYGDGAPLRAARTVYTGNYVMRASALRHFVPFAPLRLRMSGPTFGRLLQATLGARFVSANLPMLHKRTEPETGISEFRPGVVRQAQRVDLGNEFERQFFGDVMLFTVEQLTALGFPVQALAEDAIADSLTATAERLARLYRDKHAAILAHLDALRQLRKTVAGRYPDNAAAWARLDDFLDNMAYNFGPQAEGYRLIDDVQHRQLRHAQLLAAITQYREEGVVWEAALQAVARGASL